MLQAISAGCRPFTTSPISTIAWRVVSKIWSTPQRPCQNTMKQDAEAIKFSLKLFENNSFNCHEDKQLLVFFLKGFTSTADDAVNIERVAEVWEVHADKTGH